MSIHANLTGADLHEPKGVAAASAGTVYVANGSGSGTWEAPSQVVALTRTIPNISGSASTSYVVSPVSGTITAIYAVLEAAITVANANLSFDIGVTSITGSGITIVESGSAAGNEFSSSPSGNNAVTAGSVISVTSDGGSTGAAPVTVTFLINVPA